MGIQQHGSARVDRKAREGQSSLTNEVARHQGEWLWCCWHNLPLRRKKRWQEMTSAQVTTQIWIIKTCPQVTTKRWTLRLQTTRIFEKLRPQSTFKCTISACGNLKTHLLHFLINKAMRFLSNTKDEIFNISGQSTLARQCVSLFKHANKMTWVEMRPNDKDCVT